MDVFQIVITVSLCTVILTLGIAVILLSRRQTQQAKSENEIASAPAARRRAKAPSPFNPLRGVSFHDLINQEELSEKVSSNALAWLQESADEGFTLELARSRVKKTAKQKDGETSARSNAQVPHTLTGALSTQRLIETATAVVPSMVTQASPVVPVVIGCIHLVTGVNKLGPFRELDEKLGRLTEQRAIDRMSALQAVFEELKGELSAPEPSESHLKALRLKLKEIRIGLKNDIRVGFEGMKPPLPRAFLWWRWGLASKRKALRDQILIELLRLREVHVAIQLEQMIWIALAQSQTFIDEIAPDIMVDLRKIGELAQTRIGWVKGAHGKELEELKTLPSRLAEILEFDAEYPRMKLKAAH